MVDDSTLPMRARFLALVMAVSMDPDGSTFVSLDKLAARSKQSKHTVKKYVDLLEAEGWLMREPQGPGRRTDSYATTPTGALDSTGAPDSTASDREPVQNGHPTGAVLGQTGAPRVHPTSTSSTSARAADDHDYTEADFDDWARARCEAKGGGPGLLAKIRQEDRPVFEAELQQIRQAERVAACPRCDDAGMVWTGENQRSKCGHRQIAEDGSDSSQTSTRAASYKGVIPEAPTLSGPGYSRSGDGDTGADRGAA